MNVPLFYSILFLAIEEDGKKVPLMNMIYFLKKEKKTEFK